MTTQTGKARDARPSGGRPTQNPGAGALDDLGAAAAAGVAEILAVEVNRCRDAVAKALEQAIGGSTAATQPGITGLVDKLMAAAAAASNAADQRARAEIHVEVERVQSALAQTRSELEKTRQQVETTIARIQTEQAARTQAETELKKERESLKAVRNDLQAEQAARAKADAAVKDAEQARRKMMSAHETETQALRGEVEKHKAEAAGLHKQIDAEKAERARLVNAIQQVVNPGEIAAPAPAPQPSAGANGKESAAAASTRSSSVTVSERKVEPAAKPAAPAVTEPEPDPQLLAYVQHLFTTLEAMYSADVSKGRKSDDLVNSLTQYLRSARTVFQNHVGAPENGELTFFDRHLSEMLDAETPFARHLGIAAYECSKTEQA